MLLKNFVKFTPCGNKKIFPQFRCYVSQQQQKESSEILMNLQKQPINEELITEETLKLKERFLQQFRRKRGRDEDTEQPILKGVKPHTWDNLAGFKHYVGLKTIYIKILKAPQVTKAELEELLNSEYEQGNYMLLDVRSALRATDFKIPNSFNLPLNDISLRCMKLTDVEFEKRYKFQKPSGHLNLIIFSDSSDEAELAGFLLQFYDCPFITVYRGGVQDWFGSEFKVNVQLKPSYEMKFEQDSFKPYKEEIDYNKAIEEDEIMWGSYPDDEKETQVDSDED